MTKLFNKYWPIIIIIFAAFFLRIIKLEHLFHFTYDESVFAFVGRRFALWHHIPLIGGATPLGFHVAPYFYWFFAITLALGKLNPVVWGWVSALLASCTTAMMFKVGQTLGSKRAGFTAATLWAFSYLANLYDRHFWGLTFGPLFSLVIIYFTCQIIKGRHQFVYPLGLTLALIIHADLSYYIFLAFTLVVWLVFKLPVRKSTVVALSFIVISFVPLVIFDIRHNFANIRPVADFIKSDRNTPGFEIKKFVDNILIFPRASARLVYAFGDNEVSKQYSYCKIFVKEKYAAIPKVIVLASSILILAIVIWGLKSINQNPILFLASLLAALYFVGIQVYGTIFRADIFEHYITGLFAVFLLTLSYAVSKLPKKLWLTVLVLFVTLNLLKISKVVNGTGLSYKRQAIEFTMSQVGNEPFSLDSLSTCWKYSGYRYLFTVFGAEPVKSYVDPNFAYLYGTTPVAQNHPDTVVSFVTHDFIPETDDFYKRYAVFKSHEIKSSLFGRLEVIIMDNSSGWFD